MPRCDKCGYRCTYRALWPDGSKDHWDCERCWGWSFDDTNGLETDPDGPYNPRNWEYQDD